ncbi:hypothetical protein BDZ91DRAFT_833109 [Kalaharituber pfeilii]|nr:hypothetical protein BDZ91DRAFT_833109 [Kalaharituber pfeilii]
MLLHCHRHRHRTVTSVPHLYNPVGTRIGLRERGHVSTFSSPIATPTTAPEPPRPDGRGDTDKPTGMTAQPKAPAKRRLSQSNFTPTNLPHATPTHQHPPQQFGDIIEYTKRHGKEGESKKLQKAAGIAVAEGALTDKDFTVPKREITIENIEAKRVTTQEIIEKSVALDSRPPEEQMEDIITVRNIAKTEIPDTYRSEDTEDTATTGTTIPDIYQSEETEDNEDARSESSTATVIHIGPQVEVTDIQATNTHHIHGDPVFRDSEGYTPPRPPSPDRPTTPDEEGSEHEEEFMLETVLAAVEERGGPEDQGIDKKMTDDYWRWRYQTERTDDTEDMKADIKANLQVKLQDAVRIIINGTAAMMDTRVATVEARMTQIHTEIAHLAGTMYVRTDKLTRQLEYVQQAIADWTTQTAASTPEPCNPTKMDAELTDKTLEGSKHTYAAK